MATQNSTLVIPPSRAQLIAYYEVKYGFGRLALSTRDLLETAATIADVTSLPGRRAANEQVARLYLRRAAIRLTSWLQQAVCKAEREYGAILWQEPSQEQHDARAAAERTLHDARNRAYVARQQADQLVEDTLDGLLPLLDGVTLAELPGLLRLAADPNLADARQAITHSLQAAALYNEAGEPGYAAGCRAEADRMRKALAA